MIIPWLRGFLSRERAPLTWTLVLLNIFVYLWTLQPSHRNESDFTRKVVSMELTANLYAQYRQRSYPVRTVDMSKYQLEAFRDRDFLQKAPALDFAGDQIQIAEWKKQLAKYTARTESRYLNQFGLVAGAAKPSQWITYQFMHVGPLHLFSNMLLLLIFGGAIEVACGSLALVFLYLFGGIFGAFGFLLWGQLSLAPMVGASGAVSALMAFHVLQDPRRHFPYFFFLAPVQGLFGLIYLSKWWVFPLYFLSDLAATVYARPELPTGIASAAHLGGVLFGLCLGALWRLADLRNFKLMSLLRNSYMSSETDVLKKE